MARRFICSEFDPYALRIAKPLLLNRGFKTLTEAESPKGNWDWPHPHKSILDLKPLLLPEAQEPVTCATLEPMPRHYVPKAEERSASRWKVVGVGENTRWFLKRPHMTQKDNIKTITGKRREVVRQIRHEARLIRAAIITNTEEINRKEF